MSINILFHEYLTVIIKDRVFIYVIKTFNITDSAFIFSYWKKKQSFIVLSNLNYYICHDTVINKGISYGKKVEIVILV